MTTFEYHSALARPDQVLETCKELGANGWELCGTYQTVKESHQCENWPSFIPLVFKRRKEGA